MSIYAGKHALSVNWDLKKQRNTSVKTNKIEMSASQKQEQNSQHSAESYLLHVCSHVAFRLFFKLRQPEIQREIQNT